MKLKLNPNQEFGFNSIISDFRTGFNSWFEIQFHSISIQKSEIDLIESELVWVYYG
jgi:hypothetical protein